MTRPVGRTCVPRRCSGSRRRRPGRPVRQPTWPERASRSVRVRIEQVEGRLARPSTDSDLPLSQHPRHRRSPDDADPEAIADPGWLHAHRADDHRRADRRARCDRDPELHRPIRRAPAAARASPTSPASRARTRSTTRSRAASRTCPTDGGFAASASGPARRSARRSCPGTPTTENFFKIVGWRPDGDVYYTYEVESRLAAAAAAPTQTLLHRHRARRRRRQRRLRARDARPPADGRGRRPDRGCELLQLRSATARPRSPVTGSRVYDEPAVYLDADPY